MPYSQRADRARWEREHRPEKLTRVTAASTWARQQIAALEGVRSESLPASERKKLRKALVSQYLRDNYGLGNDRPEGAEKQSAPDY